MAPHIHVRGHNHFYHLALIRPLTLPSWTGILCLGNLLPFWAKEGLCLARKQYCIHGSSRSLESSCIDHGVGTPRLIFAVRHTCSIEPYIPYSLRWKRRDGSKPSGSLLHTENTQEVALSKQLSKAPSEVGGSLPSTPWNTPSRAPQSPHADLHPSLVFALREHHFYFSLTQI